MHSFDLGDNTF